jgi:hypothetical protein
MLVDVMNVDKMSAYEIIVEFMAVDKITVD